MILTNINHTIKLSTDNIKVETNIVKTLEHKSLDVNDQEQMINWYADVCKKARWVGFVGDNEGRLYVTPKLNSISVEDWYDEDTDNGIQYNIWIESTLDNAKAKNPKKWTLRFVVSRYGYPTIKHKIEWPRLPDEALTQDGFEQGLHRRNVFATLRKT